MANTTNLTSITRDSFTVEATTNRLTQKNGVTLTYDAAGNQTYDGTGYRYYDAENKISKAVQGATSYYYYDGSGKRVRRVIGGAETWQVYGFEGELVAEYNVSGTFSGSNAPAQAAPVKEYGYRGGQMLVVFDSTEAAADDKLKWLVTDHLGSTRMTVNKSGSLSGVKRRDYLPFGEELASTVGHRMASGSGYAVNDKPRQKFGSKERDTETGLDFFEARYLASVQGRFTGVDRVFFQAEMQTDPQRFNLYAYVRNNPLRFIDPKGEAIELLGTEEERKRALAAIQSAVGSKAGTYLYINPVSDSNGNTRYFVGVYTKGPDAKGQDFKDVNEVAGEVAAIIGDKKIVGIQVVEQGAKTEKGSVLSSNEDVCKCNSVAFAATTSTSGNENYFKITIPIPKAGDAYDRAGWQSISATEMADLRPGKNDIGLVIAHELGHARALMTGARLGSRESNEASLRLENKVRVLRGPSYSQRESHGTQDAIR